jgi:hypothetical protein
VALGLDMHAGSLSQPLPATSLLLSRQWCRRRWPPEADDYRRADAIVAAIPDVLHAQAVSRESAMPLLLALLLDGEQAVRRCSVEEIARAWARSSRTAQAAALRRTTRRPASATAAAAGGLAFPALRRRPRPQLDAFLDTVHAVVHADGQVALFEYCLGRLLQVQVREALDPARTCTLRAAQARQVRSELATLLCGGRPARPWDSAGAQRAYLAGMQRILPQRPPAVPAPPAVDVQALDGVWEPLDALDPLAKQALVEAVTATVSATTGACQVAESELLRTICGVLHCPLPPMLERA